MNTDHEKAVKFIGRLWDNPSLVGLSPLQKEAQLLQFLEMNHKPLQSTLTSPIFFPGFSWAQIQVLLRDALAEYTNQTLPSLFQTVLNKNIDFSFIQHMTHRSTTPSAVKNQFAQFLSTLSSKVNSRKEFIGPIVGVGTDLIDRYVREAFRRQKYISFELRKVQRLKISSNEIAHLIKTTMLIRPAVRFFVPGGQVVPSNRNLLLVSHAFASNVVVQVTKAIPLMPDVVVKAGINSTLSFQDNPFLESTSRLASVFAHRCRNLKSGMIIDRGAESSDKSWFSVARKNYKFYGFDLDMLMELHGIATENGW